MVSSKTSGVDGRCHLRSIHKPNADVAIAIISLALGAIFIYAGTDKLRDFLVFADSIAAFAIVPEKLINLMALGLPPFEVIAGLMIALPVGRRIGSLSIALCSVMFMLALSSALMRGLTLDCGCFGTGTPSRARMWLEMCLDVFICSGALYVYLDVNPHRYREQA